MASLIEKPAGQVVREAALARVTVADRPTGIQPVIAETSEEIPFLESTAYGPRMEVGIRWGLNPDDYERVKAGLVCPQCLTVLPVPALARNLAEWRRVGAPDWNWSDVTMKDRGIALILQDCCPICGFEQSPEMLALHDEGAPQRHTDPEWEEAVGSFDERADAYFDKVDREKRSTGFKPRGGFLEHRPVRSVFDKAKGA